MILLAIDGIDGSGKDSQLDLLRDSLTQKGFRVQVVTCPMPSSPLKDAISRLLQVADRIDLRSLQLVFIAERLLQQQEWATNPKMDVVILGRSVWATIVYGEAAGINSQWLQGLIQPVLDPDLVFLLDLSVEDAMSRSPAEDAFEQNVALQERCRQRYLSLAREADNWAVIDGAGTMEQVHAAIMSELTNRFPGLVST